MISTFTIVCVYSHTYLRVCRCMYYVEVEDLSDKLLTKLVGRWNTVIRKGHSVSSLNISMSSARPNHVSLRRSNSGFHELRVVRQNWHLLDYQLSSLTAVCQGNLTVCSSETKLLKRQLQMRKCQTGPL
jgi:hypothetical protein